MVKELYTEVAAFLHVQYGATDSWMCRRVLICMDAGLYFVKRDEAGKLTTYAGWFQIDAEDIPVMMNESKPIESPVDILGGNSIWVIDAASTDRSGIRDFQTLLRQRYPVSSGFKGISWLRNGVKPVRSDRQLGVNDEMVS